MMTREIAMPPAPSTELYCPECGYDLRALVSDRCPECGHAIDRTTMGQSVLPWVQRESVGRYRAFWKTVAMATFRPRFLAREMNQPARFHDAVTFRRLVVLHALVPIAGAVTAVYVYAIDESTLGRGGLWTATDVPGSILQVLTIAVIWSYLALTLFGMTGVASYFFHPGSLPVIRQNRAVALSYYACGPLAYMPATLALMVVCALIGDASARAKMPVLFSGTILLIGSAPVAAQFVAVISSSVILLEATTHLGRTRQILLAGFMAVAWAVLGFVLCVVVPAAWVMLVVMLLSLRS
jgi:hypothetical protein